MTTEQHPFFVYGTLLPGQPNDHLWQGTMVSQETAVFENGRLYDMGFYPMLIEEADSKVEGMLITVRPEKHAEIVTGLDQLEGFDPDNPDEPGYRRVTRPVRLAKNGDRVTAWLYVGQPPELVSKYPPIPDGDWPAYSAKKHEDIADWWTDMDSLLGTEE